MIQISPLRHRPSFFLSTFLNHRAHSLIMGRGDCISHNLPLIPDVFCPVSAVQKLLVRINKLSELSSDQYFLKFSLVPSTVHRVKSGEVGHTERVNLSTETSFLEGCSSFSP